MCFDSKAWLERGDSSIRLDFSRISIQLFSPNQPCLLTLIDHCLKKASEDLHAIPRTNTGQARMIGKRFSQIVPQIPAYTESISHLTHQQALRANPFKKHHEL